MFINCIGWKLLEACLLKISKTYRYMINIQNMSYKIWTQLQLGIHLQKMFSKLFVQCKFYTNIYFITIFKFYIVFLYSTNVDFFQHDIIDAKNSLNDVKLEVFIFTFKICKYWNDIHWYECGLYLNCSKNKTPCFE